MTTHERILKQNEIIEEYYKIENPTQKQTDLYHLKYLRYSIDRYSYYGRRGYISTLDRAIKRLEKEKE